MMRKLIVLLMFVLMVGFSAAYQLIDSENFQTYTAFSSGGNQSIFIGQADGKWNCTPTTYTFPYCTKCAVGGCAGTGNFTINNVAANKFLSIFDLGMDFATPKYYETSLDLFFENSSNFSSITQATDYIFRYDILLVSADATSGGDTYRSHFAMDYDRPIGGANDRLTIGLGGTNLAGNDTVLRRVHSYGVLPYGLNWATPGAPIAACDINDGNWHTIVGLYRVNSTYALNNWSVTVDGNLCYNLTGALRQFTASERFFTNELRVYARGGYWVNIDNISIWQANATENFTGDVPLESTSCSDSLDNDGDGYIDYPNDPQCTSYSDTLESPFDYTQCNNGVDDDSDSYIDLDDVSCNGSLTSSTEYPSQASLQAETPCLSEEFCLLNEKFPYTDNITLHDWEGSVAGFRVINTLGSGRLYFSGSDFDLEKAISHENTYNNVQVWFDLAMATKDDWSGNDSSIFYVRTQDIDGKNSTYLKFNLTQIDPLSTRCQIYAADGAGETLVATVFPALTASKIIGIELEIDQVLKTYQVNYRADGIWVEAATYDYADAMAGKVNSFSIGHNAFDSTKFDVYMDNINILGADTNFDTVCDEYEPPYYLVESFNGYLDPCDWVTSINIYNSGFLSLTQGTSSYYAQKTMDTITETNSRYVTVKFDMTVINITTPNSITFRLYDETDSNVFTLWWQDTGDNLFYSEYGVGYIASPFNLSTKYIVKAILDLKADSYDLYLNDTLVADNKGWTERYLNVESIKTVKFTSASSAFNLDNVNVFTSDATGNPLTPGSTIIKVIDNQTSVCGLVFKEDQPCVNDEDCETGDCLPNNICNHFDMTYCDENGHIRGNKCMFAGYSGCFFSSATEVMFDNFFYVLIAIILLIAVVYLGVMLRRK